MEGRGEELARCVELLQQAEATVEERTALGAAAAGAGDGHSKGMLGMYRASRWVRLGRTLGLGPGCPRPEMAFLDAAAAGAAAAVALAAVVAASALAAAADGPGWLAFGGMRG